MFIPNQIALYSYKTGDNKFGEPTFSSNTSVQCAVVHFGAGYGKTSVRTDSSASRGNAEEQKIAAKILIASAIVPAPGHRLIIIGRTLRALTIEPRYAVTGKLDHYEVDYEVWD